MNRLRGVDVSDWQPNIDWTQVAAAGIHFAYAKATEGVDGTQDTFIANHDGCKAAGIPFGAYHFFRPYLDGAQQAEHFLSTIDGYQGQLLPMVDVEVTDSLPADAIARQLSAFLTTLEKTLDGKRAIIYASYGFWNSSMGGSDAFSGHPFWIAEYNSDANPTLPNGFRKWVLWQYADDGNIAGIPGNVDRDLLNGNNLGVIMR